MRLPSICIVLVGHCLLATGAVSQQTDAPPESASAYCTLTDGKEISIQYQNTADVGREEPHPGKIWLPGGTPITLFTEAPLTLANAQIPVGAYSVYVLPNKKDWTLIVNKNVAAGSSYDEKQDLVRARMEMGQISAPSKQLQISFAHMAPKLCGLRLYAGKTGAFVDFQEK
jgi:hypothetical protein